MAVIPQCPISGVTFTQFPNVPFGNFFENECCSLQGTEPISVAISRSSKLI